jgi:phosphoglycolate phosphatase
VAVDFGYSETPIIDLKPDRLIGAFAQLPDAVFDLLGRQATPGGQGTFGPQFTP